MKEKIVIEDRDIVRHYKKYGFSSSIKLISIPETWKDLQELCKNLKELYKNYNIEVFDDAIFVLSIDLVLLKIYNDGMVKDSNSEIIADNRTPQQMWNIIKNLCEK